MDTAVCTLFEGDYHYGVGVLVNSLYRHGFRGVVWAGYRGNLPFWAKPLEAGEGYQEFSVTEGCVIRFVKLTTRKFFSNYKPDFMLQLWESYCPNVDALFYIDPDIVNNCDWHFYEEWVGRGIALCEDGYGYMPANHPIRLAWKEFAEMHGYTCHRELDRYYNSGFIGLEQSHKFLLSLWQKLLEICEAVGCLSLSDFYAPSRDKNPYIYYDQDVLNLALMLTSHPLSTFGVEAMDSTHGSIIMSHAAGIHVKPWRKQMIREALGGAAPTLTDKLYYQHAQMPIQLYSRSQQFWKELDIRCGSAISRFIRRAPASA
jgi:hypothetical protein